MALKHLRNCLRDRIVAAISRPLTEVGTRALECFLDLPSVENWDPKNMYLLELSRVFDFGLPFSFLVGNATTEPHRQEVGAMVCRGERVRSPLMSEVHVGALLSNWGANVRFVPRQVNPTPDIEATWGDGVTLDVEVVRGETRHLHKAVKSGIATFVGALQPGDVAWNVAAFIADASNPASVAAMFEAAVALRPGENAEDEDSWSVRAVALDKRDEVVGGHAAELFGPSWWPKSAPDYSATSTIIGTAANPVVVVRSLVPQVAYTNPILRKATSGQRQPGNPYLIALDVSDLPRAHERVVNDLNGYFPNWDHVSAVLLFEPRFWVGVERKEWVVSMHRNPSATIALPSHLAALSDREKLSIRFELSES